MLLIVHLFEFCRWYVANRFQEPLLVESGHPVESGELDIVDSLPRAVLSNDLGLVQADHRFGQRVVIMPMRKTAPAPDVGAPLMDQPPVENPGRTSS